MDSFLKILNFSVHEDKEIKTITYPVMGEGISRRREDIRK
jgi:hypothetical protein